jgi:hypothetical protein
MGAVTWKNIAPVSSAGILDSINESGNLIGTGIGGIGDAITGYADARTAQETDAVINDLLQFENLPLEADAYLKGIDNSFLDMTRIRDARKDLTADADELAMFTKKEAIKSENKIKELNLTAKAERIKAAAKKNKPMFRGDLKSKLSKRDTVDGNNPSISAPFMFFDSAAEDMDDVIQAYIKNRDITDASKQNEVRKFIYDDSVFDLDFLNEYFFSDGSTPDDNPFDHFDMLIKSRRKQYLLDDAANK